MPRHSHRTLLLAASVLAVATPAACALLLTAGKVGVFERIRSGEPRARVRVTGEPVLHALADPRCPATSSIGFAYASEAQIRVDHGEMVLPCKVFRAFTTYLNGIFQQDRDRTARGLAQMEEASTENLFFNKSVALFILPIFMSGSSEYYQTRLLPWLDEVLADATGHPDVYPDVFTSRLVPHDPESAALMFGDVALKGGRLELAGRWYGIAKAFGATSGYPFQPIVESRLASTEARLAAREEAVPSDSGIPGVLGVSPCTLCHYGTR